MRRTLALIVALSLGLAAPAAVRAQSSAIGFQAKLTGVADGPHTMTFSLYDVEMGGTPLQTVGPQSVMVQTGVVSTAVAFGAGHWRGQDRWIGVAADGGSEMTPRMKVLATPNSHVANNITGTNDFPASPLLDPIRARLGTKAVSWSHSQVYSLHGSPFPSFQVMVPAGEIGAVGSFLPPGTQLFAALGAVAQRTMGFGFYSSWYSSGGVNGDTASAVVWIKDGANNVFDVVKVREPDGYTVRAENWLLRVSVNGETQNRGLAVYDTVGVRTFSVSGQGHTTTRALTITGGCDLAEPFDAAAIDHEDESIEPAPGMVMTIDRDSDGRLVPATLAYDTAVAGVISGANGLSPGMIMGNDGDALTTGEHPLAMTGRVWVLADASFGPIRRGDRLTTSTTPGHAMRVADDQSSIGAVIGKAMTELEEGRGHVLVLVNLQ